MREKLDAFLIQSGCFYEFYELIEANQINTERFFKNWNPTNWISQAFTWPDFEKWAKINETWKKIVSCTKL